MTAKVVYKGDLSTELTHIKSESIVRTDAPTDNNGKGMAFSPTDLLATSLASCMLTVVGIKADTMKVSTTGSYANVTKHMAANPRRVVKIDIDVYFKGNIGAKEKAVFENTAKTCPVAMSLSTEIEQNIKFYY
ncbi:MAG: OsmC family protein [Bacteroidia bacterium]